MLAERFAYVCLGLLCLALTYHVGARKAGAHVGSQEVAVLSGEIANGGTIPLPHYQDGTEALESECQWTVSANDLFWAPSGPADRIHASAENRVVSCYICDAGCDTPGGNLSYGTANYLIIAVRTASPTSTRPETWGSVKTRYR